MGNIDIDMEILNNIDIEILQNFGISNRAIQGSREFFSEYDKKNDIRDVGSTADLVLVFFVHLVPGTLVPTGTHWFSRLSRFSWFSLWNIVLK